MTKLMVNELVIEYPNWVLVEEGQIIHWYFQYLDFSGEWKMSSIGKNDNIKITDFSPFLYRKPNSIKAWAIVCFKKILKRK